MTKRFIKNATWAADGSQIDILLEGSSNMSDGLGGSMPVSGSVSPTGQNAPPADAEIIDATNQFILPALVDMHAKVSQPGKSSSLAIKLASEAARQGGIGSMLVMPTKSHSFDNHADLDSFRDAVKEQSCIHMCPAGHISIGGKGEQQAPYDTLAARGVRILSDAEHSPSNLLMLQRAMRYIAELGLCMAIRGDVAALSHMGSMHHSETSYKLGLHGIPACAEEIGIETLIRLAKDTKAKLHIQTVSTAEGVRILQRAGDSVSAEVALHHLIFSHEDIADYDTSFKTQPPLRDKSDREALLAAIKEGSIDCIVSDHTPCAPFAKKQDFHTAPQGMLGLDTFLPAIYSKLIKTDKLSWAEVIRACSSRPAEILYGHEAHDFIRPLILFNPNVSRSIEASDLPSRCINSPFLGAELLGEVSFL